MSGRKEYKVLCVDDEPNVLQGLELHLRRSYDVYTANGGAEGLKFLEETPTISIVLSDMRMPGMDGAEFLKRAAEVSPNSVRLLLTGHTDIDVAISAINDGRIFRFLTKPCPPNVLQAAFKDAIDQYKLIISEKELLNKTLQGSIGLLMEILSLVDSQTFGRSLDIRDAIRKYGKVTGTEIGWEVELAAMLSQLAIVAVPPEIREKDRMSLDIEETERDLLNQIPEIGFKLIRRIPRLENVAKIIRYQEKRFDGSGLPNDPIKGADIPFGSRVLKILLDMQKLELAGKDSRELQFILQSRQGWYDPQILKTTFENAIFATGPEPVIEIPIESLRIGDLLKEDIETQKGLCLLAKGNRITETTIEKIRMFATLGAIKEPLFVSRHQYT